MEAFDLIETKNKKLRESKEYKIAMEAIANLWNSGIILRGSGYCHSLSDMIHKIFLCNNIKSRLVECSVVVTTKNPPTLNLLGEEFSESTEKTRTGEQMNTHVICITETPIQMIIDLSVYYMYPMTKVPFICEELIEDKKSDISGVYKIEYPNSTWIYQEKKEQKIPEIHQTSILKRYKTDKKIFDSIDKINKVLMVTTTIIILNFIRGGYDFSQKYIIKDNGFGPTRLMK